MAPNRKRILFVTLPGLGHLFPLIPLAWALRSAGHKVLIATCGISINASVRAGLPVVNVAPGVDLTAVQERHRETFKYAYPPNGPDGSASETTLVFNELCEVMADGVIDAAERFRSDLIVYVPEAVTALIAASKLQIPSVFFSIGLGHTPSLMNERYSTMRPIYERRNVPKLPQPYAWIDLTPRSLRPTSSEGWPMRYIEYNGGGLVPLERGSSKPCRVAVTLGTLVPSVCGLSPFRAIIEAAKEVDAEFVIAYGAGSERDLGPLPANVRAGAWIGLDELSQSSTVAIHHGGFGTTLTMLGAGLPQLILPHGADQFFNAQLLQRRGAAFVPDQNTVNAAAILSLLSDESLRAAAEDVAAEIGTMPTPADVAPQILRLIA